MKRNRRAKERKIIVRERETNNKETAEAGTTEKAKKVQEKEGKVIKKVLLNSWKKLKKSTAEQLGKRIKSTAEQLGKWIRNTAE